MFIGKIEELENDIRVLRENDGAYDELRKRYNRLRRENEKNKDTIKNKLGPVKQITELKNVNYVLHEKVRSLSLQVTKTSK